MRVKYKMTYDEAYEAFYLIANKRSITSRYILAAVLGVVCIALGIMYALEPLNIVYSFLAFSSALMMMLILVGPHRKAKKGALWVEKKGGIFELNFDSDGYIKLPNSDFIELKGDKDSRAYETKNVFALRADRVNSFCIPKRALNSSETEFIRKLLKDNMKYYVIKNNK